MKICKNNSNVFYKCIIDDFKMVMLVAYQRFQLYNIMLVVNLVWGDELSSYICIVVEFNLVVMEVDNNIPVWSILVKYEYKFQIIWNQFPNVLFWNGHK